jgi:hypothetical protein
MSRRGSYHMSYLEETDRAQSALRTRLELPAKEKLIEVIMRLAADSEESAARIDYLTDPSEAVKMLQRRISSIRNGKRFVSHGESGDLAAQIATISADIRADLLPTEPAKAKILAEKLFSLDQVVFERADDSGGSIGSELRDACVLWLDAAAVTRAAESDAATRWIEVLHELYQKNDHGIRESLLKEAHRLLGEEELRALAPWDEPQRRDWNFRGARAPHAIFRVGSHSGLSGSAVSAAHRRQSIGGQRQRFTVAASAYFPEGLCRHCSSSPIRSSTVGFPTMRSRSAV